MHDAHFADGFDGPEKVAFGLGPAQLLTVVVGLLLAYLALQAPLPPFVSATASVVLATGSAVLGWFRIEGRPVTDWLLRGGHYLLRRHSGSAMFTNRPPSTELFAPASRPPLARVTARTADARAPTAGPTLLAGEWPPSPPPAGRRANAGRVITFFSLNGGSGRTTLATEVGCLLADRFRPAPAASTRRERLDVVLLDLDALAASVATRLGLPQPTPWEYSTGGGPADPVTARLMEHRSGLRLLLGPPKPLQTRAQQLELARVERLALRLRARGDHIVIIDIGTDLGPMARWGLEACDQIYIVFTPTAGGVLDAYRSTEMLRRLGHRDKLAYVVNRCPQQARLDEVMADLGGHVVAAVPPDEGFAVAEAHQEPLALAGTAPAMPAISLLAAHVCAGLQVSP